MRKIDELLEDNRLELRVSRWPKGTAKWIASLIFHPCDGPSKDVFLDQFYTYEEMRAGVLKFVNKFDKQGDCDCEY